MSEEELEYWLNFVIAEQEEKSNEDVYQIS